MFGITSKGREQTQRFSRLLTLGVVITKADVPKILGESSQAMNWGAVTFRPPTLLFHSVPNFGGGRKISRRDGTRSIGGCLIRLLNTTRDPQEEQGHGLGPTIALVAISKSNGV